MRRAARLAFVARLTAATARPHSLELPYDGRFTFVRLRWAGGNLSSRGWSAAWNHDYPGAEQHLAQILNELTLLDIHIDGSRILTLDDPQLFRYPVAFMCEPGFWTLSDREAECFRAYLLKGGFAVFEDFDGRQQWANFETQMNRVLLEARFVKLDNGHRIHDSFFDIKNIDAIVHPMSHIPPNYYGVFEDNDPAKRLMVVANFDNDVPEYLGVVGPGPVSVRRVERSLQARRELGGRAGGLRHAKRPLIAAAAAVAVFTLGSPVASARIDRVRRSRRCDCPTRSTCAGRCRRPSRHTPG